MLQFVMSINIGCWLNVVMTEKLVKHTPDASVRLFTNKVGIWIRRLNGKTQLNVGSTIQTCHSLEWISGREKFLCAHIWNPIGTEKKIYVYILLLLLLMHVDITCQTLQPLNTQNCTNGLQPWAGTASLVFFGLQFLGMRSSKFP